MTKKIQKRELIPPWNMPSDPVKAVVWFLHWSLKVLVRFCWIPIIAMTLLELYLNWIAGGAFNGLIAGIVTFLVGMLVWGALFAVLFALNINASIGQILSEVGRMQQGSSHRRPFNPFFAESDTDESKIVEGTITDLDQERKKRRRE